MRDVHEVTRETDHTDSRLVWTVTIIDAGQRPMARYVGSDAPGHELLTSLVAGKVTGAQRGFDR